jgi:hypothetical protein
MILYRRAEVPYRDRGRISEDIRQCYAKYKPKVTEGRVTVGRDGEPHLVWMFVALTVPDDGPFPDLLPLNPDLEKQLYCHRCLGQGFIYVDPLSAEIGCEPPERETCPACGGSGVKKVVSP